MIGNKSGKFLTILVLLLCLSNILMATSISTALKSLCSNAKGMLAVGVMLMIILAAVTYAVGQLLGAETRARATVWATAMMTGAIFGALIYVLVPYILNIIDSADFSSTASC
jgi:hypothetical protein